MTIHSEYDAFEAIAQELHRARRLHPVWPGDPIHAAAIVSEEAGELVKAVNDWMTGKGMLLRVIAECVETGAMAIRFLTDTPALNGNAASITSYRVDDFRQLIADQDATIQALRAEVQRLHAERQAWAMVQP
jgi:hypothetical protein